MATQSNTVFLDTSGWIALLNADDGLHASVRSRMAAFEEDQRILFTTDWILAETGNGLAGTRTRDRFFDAVVLFLSSPNARMIRIDVAMFHDALNMYKRAGDKNWGLVDCASFNVMRSEGIMESLTADHHFEQAGFCPLLEP